MNENIVDFKNIYVSYGQENVLENINLNIKQGEHWAILGQNGSGKSTLIKLFSNDLYPNTKYEFTKEIFGKKIWSIFELKKHLGIITNDLHNYFSANAPYLSAYKVVLSGFYSSVGVFKFQDFTSEQLKKADEILQFLEISHIKDKKVSHMSTGELRRCIIGRAMVLNPKAFILDEPTVGLDVKAQIGFLKVMQKLSKISSIILITHHFEEIIPQISKVALIYDKTIYKQGKKEEILTSQNISEVFEIPLNLECVDDKYFLRY